MGIATARLLGIVVLGACACIPTRTDAQLPVAAPAQMHHSSWTIANGAPGEVDALAQTPDGLLWIGTPTGLFHFDGVTFERFTPAKGLALSSQNVSSLIALPDSSLWIGHRFGGATRLRRTALMSYGEKEGLPAGSLNDFARDSTGRLWAATTGGLAWFDGARWHRADAYPANAPTALLVDRRGMLWVNDVEAIYTLARGASGFVRRTKSLGLGDGGALREAPDGSVYGVSIAEGLRKLANPDGTLPPSERKIGPRLANTMLIDRGANAWIGDGKTVVRFALRDVTTSPRVDVPDSVHGLSGQTVTTLFQDREYNVWVGTERGLDEFRAERLHRVALPTAILAPALVAGDSGQVWSGSFNGPMLRFGNHVEVVPGSPAIVDCAYRDTDGILWIANAHGLWRKTRTTWELVATPPERADRPIQAIARTSDGTLWLSIVRGGVFRRVGSAWSAFANPWGRDPLAAVSMTADDKGRLWIGYTNSRIAMTDGASTRRFTVADGVTVGNVLAIHVRGDEVIVGGDNGIARFDGARFGPIVGVGGEDFRGTSGIVEMGDGELWLNGAAGVTRIPGAELTRLRGAPAARVPFERFDVLDGLDGTASQIRPLPSAVRASDGTVWFATASSILQIDPSHIARNVLAPSVQVLGVDADGRTYAPGATVTLPQRTRNMQVRYTAASLAIPERVRFRYQLAGTDPDWQDVAGRREAFYTNLRPGLHRFRVIAANEDGVWNEAGAAIDIDIPPTFVQTKWFIAVCVLAAVLATWTAFRMRQRQVAQSIQSRFDATLAERTRIARELHDTLLQNFTGVALQLYAVQGNLTTSPTEAAAGLQQALSDADAALRDARYMVSDMRAPALDHFALPEALAAVARSIGESAQVTVHFACRGKQRPLPQEIEIAVFRIGREAAFNAARHADADTIDLTLDYAERLLTLTVRDDGRGLAANRVERESTGQHWGIVGMRERAESCGGSLTIASAASSGTCVTAVIPLPRES
ncbi:MAG TPA: two-component regulator propeller domain-containing protein [Gemmatimonadaceae bacterium]|jgi:signal transduction histidine kinase